VGHVAANDPILAHLAGLIEYNVRFIDIAAQLIGARLDPRDLTVISGRIAEARYQKLLSVLATCPYRKTILAY
jgi:hypothetical protein